MPLEKVTQEQVDALKAKVKDHFTSQSYTDSAPRDPHSLMEDLEAYIEAKISHVLGKSQSTKL